MKNATNFLQFIFIAHKSLLDIGLNIGKKQITVLKLQFNAVYNILFYSNFISNITV